MEQAINLFFEGDIQRAEIRLKQLIKKRPKDSRVWFLKGLIERAKGNNEEALEALDKAVEIQEKFIEAWILKGIVLRELKKFQDSLLAFNKAIEIQLIENDYEDYEILIEKAKTYFAMGKKKEAIDILKKVEEINPEDEDLKNMLSNLS